MEFQVRNYLFQLPPYCRLRKENSVTEWAYNLQHNIPNSQGLEQEITDCEIPFPARVIPTTRDSIAEIPEPTFRAPYVPPVPTWLADAPSQFDRPRLTSSSVQMLNTAIRFPMQMQRSSTNITCSHHQLTVTTVTR